jgi:hypothetical protein
MKKILLIFLIIGSIALVACTEKVDETTDPVEVIDFESCIKAGYPAMESYPRQCTDGTNIYVEEIEVTDFESCMLAGPYEELGADPRICIYDGKEYIKESDEQKACTREYMPVCGELQVQCIRAPCPPIDTTFSNRCEAENAGATNIREGECEQIVGNDRDEHGCIGSAGYTWDAEIGSCIRVWEKNNICELAGGIWLEQYNECEYISKSLCEKYDGVFDECASACRNDPDAEICTMQCVQVCTF